MHDTTSEGKPPIFDRPRVPAAHLSHGTRCPPRSRVFEAPHQPTTDNSSNRQQGSHHLVFCPPCGTRRRTHEVRSTDDRQPFRPKGTPPWFSVPHMTHARPRHEVGSTTAPAMPSSNPKGTSLRQCPVQSPT
ncbi:unnamed protein product [Ectocarpus fasciculatus]